VNESNIFRKLELVLIHKCFSLLYLHLPQGKVDILDGTLQKGQVPILLLDDYLPVELKDIHRVSLIQHGLIPPHVVALNINSRVGSHLILSKNVSLPFGQRMQGFECASGNGCMLKLYFGRSLEQSVLDACTSRNE
jgi:hypothetical protein